MSAKHLAHGLASLGRNGDSVLVHMQPHEVAGLDALARIQGTKLTYNPETGMPEAFNLGGFFSSLLPTIVGAGVSMIPGMQFASYPMLSGMLAGAATGALTNRRNPLMGALMGGMGGFGGANLAKSAMGATADQMIKSGIEPSIGAVQSGFNAIPTNIGANMATPSAAITDAAGKTIGVNMGATNMANPITAGVNTAPSLTNVNPALEGAIRPDLLTAQAKPTAFEGFSSNLNKAIENVSNDPMKFLGENKMNLAGTLGGAALSGLEPTDIYGKPLKLASLDKYDPYATLNLSGDTGLRLYAAGGPVSFADGGDAMKGGGAGAMEGAGLMPVDVADINEKYGYNPDAGGAGLAGIAGMGGQPRVSPPMVGAFADADTINSARDAYERQLQQSMANRGMAGLLGPRAAYAQQLNAQRTGSDGSGNAVTRLALANTAPTAQTARTADTAPTANTLNLNRQYAEGGSITTGGIRDLYGSPDDQANGAVLSRDGYGLGRLQKMYEGGMSGYKKGGYLDGPGDGMSDSIPATIQGRQPARLADGEFVIPADVVSHIGNGSSKAGAKQLYSMMDRVRKARTGTKKQGKRINAVKHLPA